MKCSHKENLLLKNLKQKQNIRRNYIRLVICQMEREYAFISSLNA